MKPILFNTEMVRAIIDARKTQTRRVIKYHGIYHRDRHTAVYPSNNMGFLCVDFFDKDGFWSGWAKPPYQTGDILYVRETWKYAMGYTADGLLDTYVYKADGKASELMVEDNWRPSIHMPREAARIFLRVTDLRVERLQDISGEDVRREGCILREWFENLWDRVIKKPDLDKYGWDANPWVWVISFERCNPYGKGE